MQFRDLTDLTLVSEDHDGPDDHNDVMTLISMMIMMTVMKMKMKMKITMKMMMKV
jgi:hypothetical protein